MNNNEYVIDEKRFIRTIIKCRCFKKKGEQYVLACKIIQRGEHAYIWDKEREFIGKEFGDKGFYLSPEAEDIVRAAAAEYDMETERAKGPEYTVVPVEGLPLTFYYMQLPDDWFNCYMEYTDDEGRICCKMFRHVPLEVMAKAVLMSIDIKNEDRGLYDRLFNSTSETIDENPFYISAKASGNEEMERRLRLSYRIATKEDCEWLSDRTGKRILPSLPKEYNRSYAVETDAELARLLIDSGFQFLHRPSFSMKGCTHKKMQINPHIKMAVDAGRVDAETISAGEFLKMYEGNA